MKRIALLLVLGTLAGATFTRLPEAGDAVNPHAQVDSDLQAVFAAPQHEQAEEKHEKHISTGEPSTGGTGPSLADALTLERRASLWWEYARDVASVTSRLTRKGKTTLLVPVDRAIMKLPRKPHQNADGSVASEKEAAANVENFLASHIVPGTLEGGVATKTLNGNQVTLEGDEGAFVVQPGNIKVLGVTQASNGRIFYLDGVIAA